MIFPEKGRLLRVFISESDRHEGRPLHEWIVHEAMQRGLAGATVLRGLEGYGVHSQVHTSKVLRLSTDLPIVVEIVDTTDKLEDFVAVLDGVITEGMATLEKVDIRFYRK